MLIKTKIVVFRKRRRIFDNEVFHYNGIQLDIVDEFCYLGTVFSFNGSFSKHTQHIVGKALKALNTLMFNWSKCEVKPSITCQSFDSFVGAVLGYGSEIWGYNKYKNIETVHLKFCKQLLNVRRSTASVGVYGELGRAIHSM